jgi:serine/threonine protein kinase
MLMNFEDLEILDFLQEGGWGKVYSARLIADGRKVAVKFFGYTANKPNADAVSREVDLMQNMKGIQGVAQLIGVFTDTPSGLLRGQTKRHCVEYPAIVMELLSVDIFTFISTTKDKVSEQYLATIFRRL